MKYALLPIEVPVSHNEVKSPSSRQFDQNLPLQAFVLLTAKRFPERMS